MRNIIPLYPEPPAIVREDEEYDRKECIALVRKVGSGNRELAQWLADHRKTYPCPVVAEWIKDEPSSSYNERSLRQLRKWAEGGFVGRPFGRDNKPDNRRDRTDGPLKTHDNFQDDELEPSDEVEDPAQVLTNVLDSIEDAKALAEAYRKIFKVSSFDREAKAKIYNAINNLIVKWRTVQSTLDKKGHGNAKS
jgi:hypothetical protein